MMIGLLASFWLAQAPPAQVIVIGIDGLGASGYRQAQKDGRVPRMEEMRAKGAWTLKARAVIPTVSSPNWASMIMGAGPEQHGITSNEWQPDKFEIAPVCGAGGRFPTLFALLREQRPALKTAVIHDWDGFGRLVEPGAAGMVRHVKGGSAATAEFAIDYWKSERPSLMFVHLDDVDHAGHEHGWESAGYQASIAAHDALVGRFLDMVRGEKSVVVLLTADHGGLAKKHGGSTMAEIEIPWMMAGAGVRAREITGPVNIQDSAATLAALWRLKTPACWEAKAIAR